MKRLKPALRIGIPLGVVAALVIGFSAPALADRRPGNESKPTPTPAIKTVQGKVVAIAPDSLSFKIQNPSGNVTVSVNATTAYFLAVIGKPQPQVNNKEGKSGLGPLDKSEKEALKSVASELKKLGVRDGWKEGLGTLNRFVKTASFSDIALGDRVIARLAANNVATRVLIIKVPPVAVQSVKGTIASVTTNPNTITINSASGPVALKWDASTRFVLHGLTSVAAGQYASAAYNKNTTLAKVIQVFPSPPK